MSATPKFAARAKDGIRSTFARAGISVERVPNRLSLEHHLLQLIEMYEVQVILDVGANCGQFATELRSAGLTEPIVSFEPVREAFAELAEKAANDPAWTVRQIALGDEPGTLTMNIAESSTVSSFLPATQEYRDFYEGARLKRTEEVTVSTVTDVARDLPYERIFLKVDTQGYDLRVVRGATPVLDRIAGIMLELSVVPIYDEMPGYAEVIAEMETLGFVLSGVFHHQFSCSTRLRLHEFDGIFIRA